MDARLCTCMSSAAAGRCESPNHGANLGSRIAIRSVFDGVSGGHQTADSASASPTRCSGWQQHHCVSHDDAAGLEAAASTNCRQRLPRLPRHTGSACQSRRQHPFDYHGSGLRARPAEGRPRRAVQGQQDYFAWSTRGIHAVLIRNSGEEFRRTVS